MPRQRDESRVAEAARLYASGQTTREIAAAVGVDPVTVRRWLGDAVRRRGPRGRADVTDERILDYRDRESLSFAEIARRVHMSRTGVRMRYYQLTRGGRPDRA